MLSLVHILLPSIEICKVWRYGLWRSARDIKDLCSKGILGLISKKDNEQSEGKPEMLNKYNSKLHANITYLKEEYKQHTFNKYKTQLSKQHRVPSIYVKYLPDSELVLFLTPRF